MYLSMLKINSLLILLLLCSCSAYKGSFEIPSEWHTPLLPEMTAEDPACFSWWEEFEDPLLNDLIEKLCQNPDVQLALCTGNTLEAANKTAADIARSYIELRGLQARLEGLEKQTVFQNTSLSLNIDLANTGFISSLHQNENAKQLFHLFTQISELKLAIERAIFHLATLTTEPLDCLYDSLFPLAPLHFPCNLPIGTPCEIVENHPSIKDAREAYYKSKNRLAFYNYQKKVMTVFEQVESSLAALKSEKEVVCYLENILALKAENLQLIQDLNQQGLKSDEELQAAHLELLAAEDALIQSKTRLLIDYVNLYEAQGGGFEL